MSYFLRQINAFPKIWAILTFHLILDKSSYKRGWREATIDFSVGWCTLAHFDNTQNIPNPQIQKKYNIGKFSSPKLWFSLFWFHFHNSRTGCLKITDFFKVASNHTQIQVPHFSSENHRVVSFFLSLCIGDTPKLWQD